MRVHKAIVMLGLAALLVWGTAAQDQGVKIGVVDLDQAINATDQGKKAREELQEKEHQAQQQMQPLFDKYKKLQDEIKNKRFVLSDQAMFQKQLDLAELQNKIQNQTQELKGQLKLDRERIEGPLRDKISNVVDKIGKDEGFTLIFARGTPGLLYNREALDITDLVIKKFNASKD